MKAKPSERLGRKATGLRLTAMYCHNYTEGEEDLMTKLSHLFFFVTIFFAALCKILFFDAQVAEASDIGGKIRGNFTGTIDYEQPVTIEHGVITGDWFYNTGSGQATLNGTFSSVGLSGNFDAEYDWAEQKIIGTWSPPASNEIFPFSLSLQQGASMAFSGTISGVAPDAEGPVNFSIVPHLEIVDANEFWSEISGSMDGTWTGTVTGNWTTTVNTPQGNLTYTDSFSAPAQGEWYGTWQAEMNTADQIQGTFQGVFEGLADVSVDTPVGALDFQVPVRGVHEGSISLQGGQVTFSGAWQELMETQGTTGSVDPSSVNQGYGGGVQLQLDLSAGGFPFPVSGTVTGGGVFQDQITGYSVTVEYLFTGSFQGNVKSTQ